MKKKILVIGIVAILISILFILTGCGNSTSENIGESTENSNNKNEEIFYGSKVIEGNGTNVGDVITCGGEKFYVISNDGVNIKMLSKYNLYVGGYREEDNRVKIYDYEESETTGIQNSKMTGGGSAIEKLEGVTYFSNSTTAGEKDNDYEGSIAEKYVNEYLDYLIQKANLDKNTVSATLITIEELEALGCSKSDGNCTNAPEWLYSTSYWTKSKYYYYGKESTGSLWVVTKDGKLQDAPNIANYLGIRPVITIPVSEIEM